MMAPLLANLLFSNFDSLELSDCERSSGHIESSRRKGARQRMQRSCGKVGRVAAEKNSAVL